MEIDIFFSESSELIAGKCKLEIFLTLKQDSLKLVHVRGVLWVGLDLWNLQLGINIMLEDTHMLTKKVCVCKFCQCHLASTFQLHIYCYEHTGT